MKPRIILTALLCVSLAFTSFAFAACGGGGKDAPLEGRYVIVDIEDDPEGTTLAELDGMYEAMDLELTDHLYMEFYEGNMYKLVLFGKTEAQGKYTRDGNGLALSTDDGRRSTATVSGKKVTWTFENGAKLVFGK